MAQDGVESSQPEHWRREVDAVIALEHGAIDAIWKQAGVRNRGPEALSRSMREVLSRSCAEVLRRLYPDSRVFGAPSSSLAAPIG